MTLDEFAQTTHYIISNERFERYLPTACYPARREIKVLTSLPPDVDTQTSVINWASQSTQNNEEFLVAFKIDNNHFKIIRSIGPYSEDQIYAVEQSCYSVAD